MTKQEAMAAFEAILFTMGESVELSQLAKISELTPQETEEVIEAMQERYSAAESGHAIRRFDDAVQLSTKEEQFDNLVKVASAPKKFTLTDTMLETLSIIAYKQPVTRQQVEEVRGVNCDFAINKLISYDLVKELGRLDAPGRPLLFGTTEQFLRCFGVRSLSDLSINTVQEEEFKEEAQQEVNMRLNI